MADIILKDEYVAQKEKDDVDYTVISTLRPRKVFNSALPNLAIGHGMKVTL
jgi:hypothetical protein